VFRAIAFSLDEYGFRMVEESIKDGRGKGVVVIEDLGPVIEGFIGGNDYGCLLIAEADDLEQEICPGLVLGQQAKFI